MAYSGLGAGTQADPYQITSVSQFKEMNSTTYSGEYFLQMNDLDFSAETGVTLSNYCCNLDGGGHTVNNIELFTGGFIQISNMCSVKNVQFIFNRFYSADLPIFQNNNAYKDNVIISGVNIICNNIDGYSAKLCAAYLSSTCTITDFTATGNFSTIFSAVNCNIGSAAVYNSCLSHVPMFGYIGAAITVNRCVYIKPFTKTSVSTSIGLFANTSDSRITITECAAIAVEFHSETTTYNSVGGFIGRGEMVIRNSYVLGSFYAPYGYYFHALHGSYTGSCVFENNYFYGNIVSNVKADNLVISSLASSGCYYCKELLTNQNYSDNYAINLTVAQFKDSANFNFDFVSTWQQGEDWPLLQNASENLSQFDQSGVFDTGKIALGDIVKISATQYSVEVLTDNTKNFGVDITELGVVVDYKLNEGGLLIFTSDSDIEAVVKTYYLIHGVKLYTDSKNYYHFHLEQIPVTDVVVDKYTLLDAFPNTASYIHGTVLIGDYLYGSSRGGSSTQEFPIVKALASDVAQFQLFPIKTTEVGGAFNMDSLVNIGDKLYTVAMEYVYQKIYMIVFDLITNNFQSYYIGDGQTIGAPSCTDGTHIYVWLPDPSRLCKIDPTIFNSTEKYNVSNKWPLNSLDVAITIANKYPHAMTVDSGHIYIGMRPTNDVATGGVVKVNKYSMLIDSQISAPPTTDDMCQTATHIFIGVESRNSTTSGYNIGCFAVRKSDLRLTQLRKLHTSDTTNVGSYASLIFGDYLIDIKTNSRIYALDISNVDNWDNDDVGAHTLKVYRMLQPDGVTLTKPINEVYLTESGEFVGFAWDVFSYVTSFNLPGLNYFAEPTVITDEAVIIGDTGASLSGYITSTGGKTVTAVGVILGQASDLSDGVDYPVTPVTTEFEKAFNDLEYGTYYFRAYATNAEGTGYGEIKSFALEIPYTEPGQPTDLDKAIQAEITINWAAPIDDGGTPVIGYKIERKASDGDWAVIVANTGSSVDTTYTETLPQGVYQYRVSAITAYTTGQPSAILEVNAVVGGGGMYRIYLGSTEIATIG